MRSASHRPLITVLRVFIICWLVFTILLAGAVYYEVTMSGQQAPRGTQPSVIAATPQASTDQNWYYQYPMLQQPEQAAP